MEFRGGVVFLLFGRRFFYIFIYMYLIFILFYLLLHIF